MHHTVPSTGKVVKAYLFAATLPFSQYSYVEATKDGTTSRKSTSQTEIYLLI